MRELRPDLAGAVIAALGTPSSVQVPPSRVLLAPGRRLDVEQAREFLMGLDGRMAADPSPARLAYLIGRLEGHASSLLDVIDAITEVTR